MWDIKSKLTVKVDVELKKLREELNEAVGPGVGPERSGFIKRQCLDAIKDQMEQFKLEFNSKIEQEKMQHTVHREQRQRLMQRQDAVLTEVNNNTKVLEGLKI